MTEPKDCLGPSPLSPSLAAGHCGFTLLEIMVVMVMIGVIVAIGLPKIGSQLDRQNLRAARQLITTMHAKARASARWRSRRTALAIRNGNLVIVSNNPVTNAIDTVGATNQDVVARYGIGFTVNPSGRDSLVFDPRGLGTETSTTQIYVSLMGYTDTITISPLGKLLYQ